MASARAFLFALAALAAAPARAAPFDQPFVGGLGFNGPTDGNLAAIYWNPAALGLVNGLEVMVAGSARLTSTTVRRAGVDPTTGAPYPAATARDLTQPATWPPGPGGFVAVGWGGDRFALGVAAFMPELQQIHFPTSAAGNDPTRYQILTMDLRNLALVPALSIRFGSDLRVGVAPGFLFSTGSLSFAEDTALDGGAPGLQSDCGGGAPCGVGNPAAAARYNIASGQGIGDATLAFTLGGGVYYRHRNWELGLAYQSRPFGGDVNGVEVVAEQTTIALPPRAGGGLVSCNGQSARCVLGDVSYQLPDVFIGGVTWRARPGLEFSATARWIWLHLQDRIDIRLIGPSLDATGLPQHIVLFRGLHDAWDVRGRVAYWWRERVRVGGELRIETSAVDASDVNAAAVDGVKIEPVALVEVRLGRRFYLGAGYGIVLMPDVNVQSSAFDPDNATACVAANGDLTNPACQRRAAGLARPSAAGTYASVSQDLGLTLRVRF